MNSRFGKRHWMACVQVLLCFSVSGVLAQRPGFLRVSGVWQDGQAVVIWDEYGYDTIAGYRVYRLSGERADPIHDEWVYMDFNRSGGAIYQLPDPMIKAGQEATYRIDGLQMDGTVTNLGVWTVAFPEETLQVQVLSTKDTDPVVAYGSTEGPALKVPVQTHDIYAVSFDSIATGLGLSVSNVAEMAINTNLAMHTAGQSVSYWVDTEHILFFGFPVTNRYTITNYFWIEPGPGVHMASLATDAIPVSDDLTHIGHAAFRERMLMSTEQDPALPDDFYFWHGYSGSTEQEYAVPLPGYATNDVNIAIQVRGFNTNENHEAVVKLNDVVLGEVLFSRQNEVIGSFSSPAGTNNQLKVSIVQPLEGGVSIFALRKFDAYYERYYEPIPDVLLASDGGHARLTAARFTDAVVLDVTDPYVPRRVVGPDVTIPTNHSWAVSTNSHWALREQADVPVLSPVPGGFGDWMLSGTNQIDYLVIAPRAFQTPAEDLAAYRATMGLRTAVAIFEDICDHFAYGLKTPDAIRDMLQYTHTNWASPPWMVVLGGRGHFDYLEKLTGTVPNHLPPLLGYDSLYLRPADVLFADVTGDELADVSLGRIPVQTATQFTDYLAKLQAYEAGLTNAALDHVIFVADNADDGGDFAASNARLSGTAAARYSTEETSLDTNTLAAVRNATAAAVQAGYGILHYTGHGAAREFADFGEVILSDVDVNNMAAHDPVGLVIALTCYIGRFDDYRPLQKSLGETLITKPDGGALAVYAAGGLSTTLYAEQLAEVFYQAHAEGQAETIGLALAHARRNAGVPSELRTTSYRTYNLLGDPALKLRGGESSGAPAWVNHYTQWRWERFTTAELLDPESSGTASAPPAGASGYVADYIFGTQQPQLRIGPAFSGGTISWPARGQATDVAYRLLMAPDPWGPWTLVDDGNDEITFSETDEHPLQNASRNISPSAERLFFKLEANLQ